MKIAKPFILPLANVNNDRVIAYLRGRGIDSGIIKQCIEAGTIYESAKSHSAVFIGFDGTIPKFASERGTTDNHKKDIPGSNKSFSFCLPPEKDGSTTLACFEGPTDVLSHASIYNIAGHGWDGHRLALSGIGSASLISFLQRHPEISAVQLSLDNDKPGKDATDRIIKELLSDNRYAHMKITIAPAPLGAKDYNQALQAIRQLNRAKYKSDRPKEAVNLI